MADVGVIDDGTTVLDLPDDPDTELDLKGDGDFFWWDLVRNVIGRLNHHKAAHATGGRDALAPSDIGASPRLVPTAVKTANYTAAAGDLVPVDTTAGAVTITLPNAPADGARVAVKLVVQGGTNAVTIARAGTDVFNKTGGSTSLTLSLLFQAVNLQYKATGGIWYVVGDDLPLGDLDARYVLGQLDTDPALAANSDTRVPSQKAVKAYADALIAANDAMVFKGVIDCSANPNYPAANRGDTYKVSVAGKIGGAGGVNVEVGDLAICITDGTASGNQAAVGSAWAIVQANIDGAVIGPAAATDSNLAAFDGTTGKVIKDSGLSLDTSATLAANSDARVPSQKAVKTYVDAGRFRPTAQTSAYNAVNGDAVICDATAGAFQVTLPALANNLVVTVKKTDASAHAVTVAPAAGGTIDGAATFVISNQYVAAMFICDGANWWLI